MESFARTRVYGTTVSNRSLTFIPPPYYYSFLEYQTDVRKCLACQPQSVKPPVPHCTVDFDLGLNTCGNCMGSSTTYIIRQSGKIIYCFLLLHSKINVHILAMHIFTYINKLKIDIFSK